MSGVSQFIERALPFIFGIGFLAPVVAQGSDALQFPEPFGLSHIVTGLLIGGGWGLFATLSGRWI